MVGKFLNLDDGDLDPVGRASQRSLGLKLILPLKQLLGRLNVLITQLVSSRQFSSAQPQRRWRPPLNEVMTYWRICVSAELREDLNKLRYEEGRRLNNVLFDMLAAYRERKT